jgi:hypothetical protein
MQPQTQFCSISKFLEYYKVLVSVYCISFRDKMAQGLRASYTSLNSNVHQPPGFLPRTHRKAARCSQQICRAHSLDSVDAGSESEEDKRLSRELDLQISKKIDPQRNAKLADHLNLLWSVSQVRIEASEAPFLAICVIL